MENLGPAEESLEDDAIRRGSYAVVMPKWIGDFVLALSVVSRKAASGETPGLLVVPESLLALCRKLTRYDVVPLSRRRAGGSRDALRALRRGRFGTLYVLPHSFSSALLAMRSGVRRRRGVRREWRDVLLNEPLPRRTRTSKRHITEEYAAVLETVAGTPEDWQGIPVAAEEAYRGAVVLCPGATYGPAKKWGGYERLVDLLPNSRIVLLGSAGERDDGEAIRRRAPDRVVDLVGRTTLTEALKVIAAAKLVVANDSGLMHLAGYVGTPVVGIFGSTRPSWTRPLGKRVRVARTEIECSPCFDRTCRFGHYECLRRIDPESVAGQARELIERG